MIYMLCQYYLHVKQKHYVIIYVDVFLIWLEFLKIINMNVFVKMDFIYKIIYKENVLKIVQ